VRDQLLGTPAMSARNRLQIVMGRSAASNCSNADPNLPYCVDPTPGMPMTAAKKSAPKRQRRTPEAVRSAAVAAARTLLLSDGPEAITLPAVADQLGMRHGNLSHHFGSIGGLHAALVDQMASELTSAVVNTVMQLRAEAIAPLQVVNALFDAFAKDGAGRLIAWLAATGNIDALRPFFTAISILRRELLQAPATHGEDRERAVRHNMLLLIATALGNALIGDQLHAAVDLPTGTMNQLAAKDLVRHSYPSSKKRSSDE
jgi:TetR/AcrR family transcriptional regulator, repressor for neighboring sulfatase